LIITLIMPAATSAAAVTTFDDIETWVGFGSKEAALVLDWNDGKAPLLYGYRFDGPKSGQDMLLEIVTAQDELFARVGPAGPFGTPIYGLGVDRDADGFGISDDIGDESAIFIGFSIAETDVPDQFDGAAVSNDPDDSYHEGWNSGFWSFWTSTGLPANGGWGSPPFGANDRQLNDGDWDGLSFDPTFAFNDPPAITITVPEPGAGFALSCLSAAIIFHRRRCRARGEH
jgi:hypothetical protein